MSHDAAWTKDAATKPSDRGGRSFLRTGSSPSRARMGARWAAFSLATAVSLGGSRALADDDVFVHIDSPVPVSLSEYLGHHSARIGRRVFGWSETRHVCDSPCDRRISSGDERYEITGVIPEAPRFSLHEMRGGVTITVQPGSPRPFAGGLQGGLTALGLGVFSVGVPGVLWYTLSRGGGPGNAAWSGAGIGFMVAGGVTAIFGAVVLVAWDRSSTKIKLQRTGSAAKVVPRYWMGEF